MSYQHDWKGGRQNNLLLHSSPLCKGADVCAKFGFNSADVEASAVLRSPFFIGTD